MLPVMNWFDYVAMQNVLLLRTGCPSIHGTIIRDKNVDSIYEIKLGHIMLANNLIFSKTKHYIKKRHMNRPFANFTMTVATHCIDTRTSSPINITFGYLHIIVNIQSVHV